MKNIEDIAYYAEKALYYTCPYGGTKSLISEAKIVEQKDKTIRKETKIKTGALGKMYAETTEVYSVYRIRQCPKCEKSKRAKSSFILIMCAVILPIIVGIIKMSFVSFFLSVFSGLILAGIVYAIFVDEKIDIEDAIEKNAIETNLF